MDKDTHVYCVNCTNGELLITSISEDKPEIIPTFCLSCDSYDPEDSKRFEERPNYIQKESVDSTKRN